MTIASSNTFTWYPAIATTASYTVSWYEVHRTRAEARAAVKRLAERSSSKPRIIRFEGFDGKPQWRVIWYPKAVTYNAA